jgi:sialic acid synthase
MAKRELTIGNTVINDDSPCYVIAEIGHNHQGSLEKAKELFAAARYCGVNALKLQKRDNRSLFTKSMYDSAYESEMSFGPTYGKHREALEFGKKEYQELQKYSAELKADFFATAFDFNSADFLAELGVPAFKMASGDLKSIPLLKHVAKFQKPMIVSTGGGSIEDVQRAYDAIMPINRQLCILQATASYPAEAKDLHLRVITTYREMFPEVVIGLSDHQSGISMALVAYMLGARVIEKHFTINRAWKGTDHAFSLEPIGMRKLVRDLNRARDALGDPVKKPLPLEQKPLFKMSKKLVAASNLPEGHTLTAKDVALKSPGDGLPPYELDKVLGKQLKRALTEDENIALADLE